MAGKAPAAMGDAASEAGLHATSPGPLATAGAPGPDVRGGPPSILVETAMGALPGPYGLWALLLAAFFGVPGFILARFLDTGSLDRALSLFEMNLPSVGTYFLATFGITVYAFAGIRFMRSRTRAAEAAFTSMVPDGAPAVRRAFEPVTRTLPPIILTPILLAVSLVALPDQVQDITGPTYLVLRLVAFPVAYFVYATFIWVYLSSIRGLAVLGREPLRLASFLEDSHFGLKPFGSLSLFLALVYFVGLVLVVFSFLALPPLFGALVIALALPGVVLFFLPLYALRRQMLEQGRRANGALAVAYARASSLIDPVVVQRPQDASEAVRTLLALQILEHRISDISRWPLDLRTVSWFSAILLSVAAAIATRYVFSYLQF